MHINNKDIQTSKIPCEVFVIMDYMEVFSEYIRNIRPSQYAFLFPLYDRSKLDELALTGRFPSISGLQSSLLVAAVLGMSRLILTYTIMKVKTESNHASLNDGLVRRQCLSHSHDLIIFLYLLTTALSYGRFENNIERTRI